MWHLVTLKRCLNVCHKVRPVKMVQQHGDIRMELPKVQKGNGFIRSTVALVKDKVSSWVQAYVAEKRLAQEAVRLSNILTTSGGNGQSKVWARSYWNGWGKPSFLLWSFPCTAYSERMFLRSELGNWVNMGKDVDLGASLNAWICVIKRGKGVQNTW